MPRQARLDIPGLLQHVIVRGIERRNIFRNNTDRRLFVERLANLLQETDTDCFAWALIPNHFHLLLRPNRIELKQFMRRLLTGYAITFNTRHNRAGHVFQNRYKSIVCEEETYLLELIRYIHLNPLRANIVSDIEALKKYKWCGHAVLMGIRSLEGQAINEVLARFDIRSETARLGYLKFIADGVPQGKRPELVGGGLKRSLGSSFLPGSELELFDERVLGCGAFVEQLRKEQELRDKLIANMKLPELMTRVGNYYGITPDRLKEPGRSKEIIEARDVFCHIAVRVLLYPGTETGRFLHIGRSAASHAVRRGGKIIAKDRKMIGEIIQKPY